MKKILYLLILCLISLNLFACKKKEDIIIEKGKKEYNNYTSTVISEEDYELLISNFIANLTESIYDYKRMEAEDYEIFIISLNGDPDTRIWVYVFKPQNLKYYEITPDTFSGNEDDYFIYIPEDDGSWMLTLYASNDENCYYAILANDSDIESIAAMIFDWMK